ncbi:ribosome hibernation-promoting factor, HPF/YfiA family [Paeniglutamicibacter gangotriensis]|uniref:Ribosome hibernation promoting factor n=1 Tax=Paeniglutamicibacter gangotriensis Lz1y TaxID=1276920 RepID=M7MT16_9MICC|nr:ribosome-associated translation inhibitor RaiA [Paeniglutamicibacter gangotriensis]EMQ98085.1 sigma 54 modulation protein/30S ribosomal protein S30EA [Paeniglutamicibacter gangotriensis Lz1y]
MEMTINGRNVSVTDRFREYVDEKIDKVDQLATKIQRLDIKVTKEQHARNAESALTVELTVLGRGPAIRAEAKASDKFAAFDTAFAKLLERLRKARDRRKVHHGSRTPKAVHEATSGLEPAASSLPLHEATRLAQQEEEARSAAEAAENGAPPIEIRRKVFPAESMSVDDAVDRMEMIGHPFYLFVDEATGAHSVVYARKSKGNQQYSYGTITLDPAATDEATLETRRYRDPLVEPANA